MFRDNVVVFILLFAVVQATPGLAQSSRDSGTVKNSAAAKPIVGLRDNRPQAFAFVDAEVIVEPGRILPRATVLVEGTSITAMGADLEVPSGFKTIDCTGKKIYPGLIDAWSEAEVEATDSLPAHWNANVTPHRMSATVASESVSEAAKLRSQGITTRVLAPQGGIVKGSSCVVLLSEKNVGLRLLKEKAWQHLQLTVPRGGSRPAYPRSPMGAVALLRQSLLDAKWYQGVWKSYFANPKLLRPETNLALDALAQAIADDHFLIDAQNERMAIRADAIAKEFSLKAIIRGSGREYRAIDEVIAMDRAFLLPVDFPETPDVTTTESASRVRLQDLMHWDLAPENPARLSKAGVSICLTTDGLENVGDFLDRIGQCIERGIDPDAALAAVTTTPARLTGLSEQIGKVRPGMLANLILTDGDLFADKTKVLQCWVAGEQFIVKTEEVSEELAGSWNVSLQIDEVEHVFTLVFEQKSGKLTGEMRFAEDTEEEGSESKKVKLKNLIRERDRMSATLELGDLGNDALPAGVAQLNWLVVSDDEGSTKVTGAIVLPNGRSQRMTMSQAVSDAMESKETAVDTDDEPNLESKSEDESESEDESNTDDVDADEASADEASADEPSAEEEVIATPVLLPLGAFGCEQRITAHPSVLFRRATVWTCDTIGTLQNTDVLIRDGRIVAIGERLQAPDDCQVIDAKGKHITPGIIDCHSHMGTDGGINESGQSVTAEVRIGDFIDNSDISIYRQLAGGVTTSNILHGSANAIGGQNQVIKLRWGDTMDGLRMIEAPAGIKFALGENVKRRETRYPNTRMGVEQIIRDQLLAAREYQAKWRRWRRGERDLLLPRVDLQMEALAEVQRGERWIHCHSYRQDEIVATLDVLEEFGIQIGTLQHILEGYKVADRMVKHGAMGSSFSDWWAYKFEVFDAIPYNGALMYQQGVVVSFNSDDRELARHLNTEAAKATKYGNVPEEEALKFVTLNPAKQLRIDEYVGSIAVGKHADLVVWSGRPLSTLSRCEQTWIDGKRYFDLTTDKELRERDRELRARLVQKVLRESHPKKSTPEKEKKVEEEDRWARHDVFCATHDCTQQNCQKQLSAKQQSRGSQK